MSAELTPTPDLDYDEMMTVNHGLRGFVEGVLFYGIIGFGVFFPLIGGFFGELIY